MKLALRLPEEGSVHVTLTLDRNGAIAKLAIDKTNNHKNHAYIAENLPKLAFPPFGSHYTGERTHTFRLTLTS